MCSMASVSVLFSGNVKINGNVKFQGLAGVRFFSLMGRWNFANGKLISRKQQYNKIITVYQFACESFEIVLFVLDYSNETLCADDRIFELFFALHEDQLNSVLIFHLHGNSTTNC